jgi:hypothetical protein
MCLTIYSSIIAGEGSRMVTGATPAPVGVPHTTDDTFGVSVQCTINLARRCTVEVITSHIFTPSFFVDPPIRPFIHPLIHQIIGQDDGTNEIHHGKGPPPKRRTPQEQYCWHHHQCHFAIRHHQEESSTSGTGRTKPIIRRAPSRRRRTVSLDLRSNTIVSAGRLLHQLQQQ